MRQNYLNIFFKNFLVPSNVQLKNRRFAKTSKTTKPTTTAGATTATTTTKKAVSADFNFGKTLKIFLSEN